MSHHRSLAGRARSAVSAVAAGALALGGLALFAAPAQAAPVFTPLQLGQQVSLNHDAGCTTKSQTIDPPVNRALTDNGSASSSISGMEQVAPGAVDPVSITSKASQSVSVKTRTRGGDPLSIQLSARSSVSTTATAGNTCKASPNVASTLVMGFTTSRPLWVTLRHTRSGPLGGFFALTDGGTGTGAFQVDMNLKGAGTTTWLLPAGTYQGNLQTSAQLASTDRSSSRSGVAAYSITFAPLGSAIARPSGAALSYTSLSAARSCSTHTLSAAVTKSKSKFKRIAKVSWSVNGKTVKTLKGSKLKRGTKVKLRIGDTAGASVRATVKLKSGKTRTARASYLACA